MMFVIAPRNYEKFMEIQKYSSDAKDVMAGRRKLRDLPGLKSYLLKKFLEIFTIGPVYCNGGKDNDVHSQK